MLPVIALIGRPNVGKSTLFNQLTRSRDALVADFPGLTRDRQYGSGKVGERPYIVVDTGGLVGDKHGLDGLMADQVWVAVEEADIVLFLLDARDGINLSDEQIADRLRRSGKTVRLVLNKTDAVDTAAVVSDTYALGLGEPAMIAAAHGRGIGTLMERVLTELPVAESTGEAANLQLDGIRIAVVGRPNVGKSTLTNRMLGEERVLVFDQPGTTRDSIYIPFDRDGDRYTLIDTAGVRRRSKINEAIEKFSIIKTLQAINDANVVILVLDAHLEVSEQDATLAGHVVESGTALVLAINKWDGLADDERQWFRDQLDRRLIFLDFAERYFISALHGSGVGNLFEAVQEAYKAAVIKVATPELTRLLERAVHEHQPPLVRGRRIKLRYAHQGGQNPPVIVIHGNQTNRLPQTYKRYLNNYFRKVLRLVGTPIRLQFKTGNNPYEGKRNKLTPRQQRSRKRMIQHVKKK
ncbi:GTP-binding protein EngA [hydrothermal vent metagenome]|uniref:GTPase Der n=1 Tax=hydrothermal vent metagenome TaxID=652676 RepID=A0A3B0YBD4_9ZZZZ